MKNLIEISRIVTKKKVRKIEVFDSSTLDSKSSKFGDFYEALTAGKFKNDRDAATLLYGCSPTDDKYRQLKSRFRKRLLNTLFFIDINEPGAAGYDRAYFSCNKDWTLVKILMSNNAHNSAGDLASQILTLALKFRFADIIVNCSRILRHYAAEAGNEKGFEEYNNLIGQYSTILDAEMHSEELLQRTMIRYAAPTADGGELAEQLSNYCNTLVELSEAHDSPIILYNMYLVWVYRFEMAQDYEAMLEVCDRADYFIENNPNYLQKSKVATFQLKKMSAYLHKQDFKNGRTNAEKNLRLFPEGSEIWFQFMEYYLLLALHTNNYINALAIFNQAKSNSKFKKLDGESKKKWKIYEIYLSYFIENQGIENPLLNIAEKRNFRTGRFLNDPVLYPKELRIFTVHLLVAQILFLLDAKNFPEITDRIDRLRSYATKQLDRVKDYRTIQFIRLLQQLPRANFKITELNHSDKHYDLLVEQAFSYQGTISGLEIIPYEKLWNYILSRL